MKAILISEAGQAELLEMEQPAIEADEVLVHSRAVGVCRRDVELYQGQRPEELYRFPIIPGHEWSGEIAEVGRLVEGFKVGEKVVVESFHACYTCRNCRNGLTNLCERGYDEIGFTRPGGCAEYVAVAARQVHHLPDNADFIEATLLEQTAVVVNAFAQAQPRPGAVIVVLGEDVMGLLAVQIARLFSPAALIMLGFREDRLRLARELGATAAVNMSRVEPQALLQEVAQGRGADLVFEAADHTQGVAEALHLARAGGTVLLSGFAGSQAPLSVESDIFMLRQLSVHGIFGADSAAWTYAVQLYRDKMLKLQPLISQHLAVAEYEDAMDMLGSHQRDVLKIVLTH